MPINQISQTNVPKNLSMDQFTSASNLAGSFARGCRFVVAINPAEGLRSKFPNDLHYMCEAAELPGRGFSVAEARYYGPNQMYPINTQYQPLNLVLLCRNDARERRFFDDWLDFINPLSNFRFRYPDEYYSTIDVFQYPDYGVGDTKKPTPIASYQWRFLKAWPMLINPQPVNWAEQDILRLQITFAYNYWTRPTLLGGSLENTAS